MMLKHDSPGGLNPDDGFPPVFVDVSTTLGRYDEYDHAALGISNTLSPVEHPAVLDICCGPGHFAHSLSQRGFSVTGIDLSKPQIDSAASAYRGISFSVEDMAKLPNGKYDILTNVYTSFGYLDSKAADMALLSHWRTRLRAGGKLIMELADMDRARNRIPKNGTLQRITDGVVENLEFDWKENLLAVEYRKPDGSSWLCYTRIYEQEELVAGLKNAGFSKIQCFGDFHQKPKNHDDNLVIFAEN